MKYKEFDYYIFVDYSVDLIGYTILEKRKLFELIPKISKFSHYRSVKNKKSYLHAIKNILLKNKIYDFFVKYKIREIRQNLEIYSDILEFIKLHNKCIIFASIDDHEYSNFYKLVKVVDGDRITIKQESKLIKNTPEYKVSLILDNLLNIERLKRLNKE